MSEAAAATGVGSMPGEDLRETLKTVIGTLPSYVFLPELPARGEHASMTGRAVAILDGLGADLQPAGWRLTDAPGIDHRRARSLLAQDLDVLEEELQGYDGVLKIQVAGPLTLAATVERPRGDRALADHGARRDLAQSLAAGLAAHLADVRRRVGGARVVVQVDEPAARAVLDARVPTASGFGRHRRIEPAEADRSLRELSDVVHDAGCLVVAHSCSSDVPVALLAGAGFDALSFDLGLAGETTYDAFAQAYERGVDLWPGVVASTEPAGGPPSDRAQIDAVRRLFDRLGVDVDKHASRLVVTPTCGLAGASPTWARQALRRARAVADAWR